MNEIVKEKVNMKTVNAFRSSAILLAMTMAVAGCNQQAAPAASTADAATRATASSVPKAAFSIEASGLQLADGTPVTLNGYLKDSAGKWSQGTVATAVIKGGQFRLSGQTEQPLPAVLQVGGPKDANGVYAPMILEQASYRLDADGSVVGGKYNDRIYGFTQLPDYKSAIKALRAAEAKVYANVDRNDEQAMLKAKITAAPLVAPFFQELGEISGNYLSAIVEGKDDALMRFYALINNQDAERYPAEKRKEMLAGFAAELGDNPEYQNVLEAEKLEASAAAARDALSKGKPYRDISVADKDGKQVKLSDVLAKNKLVLLDFWASWCAPCREDFPYLAKVYKDYHDAGFEIYAVSLDEEREDWLKALKQESDNGHVPWINLRAQGLGSEVAMSYGVMGLPSSYLIAGDGTILGKDMHKQEIAKLVGEQLAKLGKGKG